MVNSTARVVRPGWHYELSGAWYPIISIATVKVS
jgi:hypothetical protein